jgi:hypothetical protein
VIHPLAFLTPVLPVIIVFVSALSGFSFPIITAMLVGIVYGTLFAPATAGPKTKFLVKSIIDGTTSVAPAIAIMIGIGMLLKSVAHPSVGLLLNPLMKSILPSTGLGYVAFFTLAAPLALYRGPLNIWGMGSGLIAVMLASGQLPAVAIMAALMALGQIQGVSDPTNTTNVWMASYLGTDVNLILKKTILYVWAMAIAGLVLAAALYF